LTEFILTVYWVKIAATLMVFGALMALFIRQSKKQAEGGGTGKLAVKSRIEKLGTEYTVLDDVVVPAKYGMIRIDHVVVSPYGVFVLTLVHEAGRVSGREGDDRWEIKSGTQKNILYNPLWENRKWVNALEACLGPYPYIQAVVFTRARLKSDFGKQVMPLSRLPGFIKKYDKSVLFSDKRQAIIEKIKNLEGG